MKAHVILLIVVLCTFCKSMLVYAQSENEDDAEEVTYSEEETEQQSHEIVDPGELINTKNYNTETIKIKKFERQKWKEVIGTTDYNQEHTKRKRNNNDQSSTQNGNEGDKRYDSQEGDDSQGDETESSFTLGGGPWVNLILNILFYGAIILIIAALLFYVIKNTSLKFKLNKSKIGSSDFTAPVEDIADLDIDTLLQRTLASGNYKLVIRLYFLGLLKKLNEEGLIVWKKDKTNRDYLTELFSRAYYFEEIRMLTLAYEQVWYGDHILPTESYHQLISKFKAIDQKFNAIKAL